MDRKYRDRGPGRYPPGSWSCRTSCRRSATPPARSPPGSSRSCSTRPGSGGEQATDPRAAQRTARHLNWSLEGLDGWPAPGRADRAGVVGRCGRRPGRSEMSRVSRSSRRLRSRRARWRSTWASDRRWRAGARTTGTSPSASRSSARTCSVVPRSALPGRASTVTASAATSGYPCGLDLHRAGSRTIADQGPSGTARSAMVRDRRIQGNRLQVGAALTRVEADQAPAACRECGQKVPQRWRTRYADTSAMSSAGSAPSPPVPTRPQRDRNITRPVPQPPEEGTTIMTGDPAEEAERHRQMHELERRTAHEPEQPGPDRPDRIHVAGISLHDQPGVDQYVMARWSLIARLCRDAGVRRPGDRPRPGRPAAVPGRSARPVGGG